MNIFDKFLQDIKFTIKEHKKDLNLSDLNEFKGVLVENPPASFNFDISCNIALILAKRNKLNPLEFANEIKKIFLAKIKNFENIEIAGPGFLNIKLSEDIKKLFISSVLKNQSSFGAYKDNKKFNIEFVSANPTGPMHVGHCRGAIYGDVLSNLLKFNGNKVIKEYYINDYGNQIKNFTKSVFKRIREIKYKEKFVNELNTYPGEYIIDIAKAIIDEKIIENFDDFEKGYKKLSKLSLKYSLNMIKDDLDKLGIKHDNFFSETKLVEENLVNESIDFLKKKKFVEQGYLNPPKGEDVNEWKKNKRLIFKSTLFGDDADRALQKNDGSWTYFANDIAYHSDKVSRKYDYLINVLGADHTGYIKRITSAVDALSNNKTKLICRVCQLVKLFKNGQPFKMSKRSGDFISANDLLNEVNKDSIRFMMLNRSNDVELDFDFDKVLEKSKDNPVFYVQYCNARINSIFRTLNINLNDEIDLHNIKIKLNDFESAILRKIFDWPKIIESASKKYEPHRIPFYLYDLATLFHSYWSKGNDDNKFKFITDGKIRDINILLILKLTAIVIKNGMGILGVSLPKKM